MNCFITDGAFVTGVNYWASHASINMWSDWREEEVEKDFQALSNAKVEYVRVFPLWPEFQPLKAIYANEVIYEYRMGEEPLPDTPSGRAGVSDTAISHFERLAELAEKYHLKLIVGLLTGHMSFRFYSPQAFEGKNFLTDPTAIKWEIRFVKYFVNHFKDYKAIAAWDLGNECNQMTNGIATDTLYVWTSAITDAIRLCDQTRPVISGFDTLHLKGNLSITEHAEHVDILTTHPYYVFSTKADPINSMRPLLEPAFKSTLYQTIGGKPSFVEETGAIGYMHTNEKTESEFLRGLLFSCWAQDCHGLLWWCAFDQGHLEYAPYDWNNIGSDYGLFRKDRSIKPVGEEIAKFNHFLQSLPFDRLPHHITDAVCIVPNGIGENFHMLLLNVFALAKQADIDMDFCLAEQPLPDSKVYFMPSIKGTKGISRRRLMALLERVKSGATLYMSLDDCLIRYMPELSGIVSSSREQYEGEEMVTVDNVKLSMRGAYKYNIDRCDSEILGKSEDGTPVFVRNKYGDGQIYFLTMPVEAMVTGKCGVFHKDDMPDYSILYRKVMEHVPSQRIAKSGRFIGLTEHIINEKKRVIVAVNYSSSERNAGITLHEPWKVGKIYYGNEKIRGCDAYVFEAVSE